MVFPLRAIIFDLDGTLTPVASPWRYVHEHFGLWEKACAYHDAFFRGEFDYATWCRLDVALWAGHDLKEVQTLLGSIPPTPEALEVLSRTAAFRDADARPLALMILSSGFEDVAHRVVRDAGIEPGRVTVVANRLLEREGRIVGVPRVILGDARRDKRAHTANFLAAHNCPPSLAIAVDDREEDREVFANLGGFVHIRQAADILGVLDFLRR